MSRAPRIWAVAVLALLVSGLRAQETQRVGVRVTGTTASSVFLDQGRSSGLAPGVVVELFPPDGAPVEVIVRAVSTDTARADLPPGAAVPPVGTRGEFEASVTEDPSGEVEPRRANRSFDDLPWRADDRAFDPDGPLLAPVAGTPPERRPVDWRGRVFTSLVMSRDNTAAGSSDYFSGRLGSRLGVTNLFGNAGEVDLAFDIDRRGTDLVDSGDASDSRGRLERASYTFGLAADDPYRVQFGRFYSTAVPELGLLDGAEVTLRLQNGLRVGSAFGALPRPFPAHATGEDVAWHAFLEFSGENPRDMSGVIAVQKSWHRGAADRDLVMARWFVRPTESLSLNVHAKADIYTSGDTVKGSGVRLTESFTTLRYAPTRDHSLSVSHSHFEYVESDRREYSSIPADLLADGRVDRVRFSGSSRLSERVRLRGYASTWSDQARSGANWEIATEFDGVFEQRTFVSVAVFEVDGAFQSGLGLRLDARRRFDRLGLHAGYTMRKLDVAGLMFDESSTTSQMLRLGVDWSSGPWSVNLSGDVWFGDDEDAFSLALFGQYRF